MVSKLVNYMLINKKEVNKLWTAWKYFRDKTFVR